MTDSFALLIAGAPFRAGAFACSLKMTDSFVLLISGVLFRDGSFLCLLRTTEMGVGFWGCRFIDVFLYSFYIVQYAFGIHVYFIR